MEKEKDRLEEHIQPSDEEEEVQTNIMQVAESTDAKGVDQKIDEAVLVKPSNVEQNRIEEKLQGNEQSTYNTKVDQEKDQEEGV